MAVFTPIEEADAEPFISRYGLGLVALTPIAEGVENTNYRLDTDRGRFVLTLFENRTDAASLPFCLGLTAHAADKGLPAARPSWSISARAAGSPLSAAWAVSPRQKGREAASVRFSNRVRT
ncbi:MAG: homoserine kinase, partial [Brevundimonas sp.]